MIYNYLFFKGYQLGKWSKNFDDIPALAGVMWVALCFLLNLFTLEMILMSFGGPELLAFDKKYNFLISLILVVLLLVYYGYKGRYKKIVEKYEERERVKGKGLHPLIVIALYVIISFTLGTLTAMYKNHDGIFA
jgi:hypothetical protein